MFDVNNLASELPERASRAMEVRESPSAAKPTPGHGLPTGGCVNCADEQVAEESALLLLCIDSQRQ